MSTVNTQGDVGSAVRAQMERDRRLRQNRRKPSTVISESATVQSSSEQGGPNPNTEGQPVRPAVESEPAAQPEAEETPQEPQEPVSEPQVELERPNNVFGSKADWRKYRLSQGYTADELEGLGRDSLRDLDDR